MYERRDLIIMGFSKLKMNRQSNPFITIQFESGGRTGDGEYGWILTKKKNLLSKM
ncbi:hypothetical protein NLX74_16645 [Paenibacillus sp. MZ03-122A]|nr:hypothetical protein [Paenibacillus sp. MZ03-122A]